MSASSVHVTKKLTALIEKAFEQGKTAYEAEVSKASQISGVKFSPALRPVFMNGSPADVKHRGYILFVGLNPKLDVKRPSNTGHYLQLNRSAEANAAVTLGYFRNINLLHGYFKKRATFVEAYVKRKNRDAHREHRELLASNSIFAEYVPYHSEKAPGLLAELEDLPNVARAREAVRILIEEWSPEAIVLDGNATHECLRADKPFRRVDLTSRTGSGTVPCRVALGTHRGIPTLKCGFMGTRGGPNSGAQRAEAGRLLAEYGSTLKPPRA